MPNLKEDVNVNNMYGKDRSITKDEFLQKYKVDEKRTVDRKSRRNY